MLGQRLRRWPNIKASLAQHLLFDGHLNCLTRTTFQPANVDVSIRRWHGNFNSNDLFSGN